MLDLNYTQIKKLHYVENQGIGLKSICVLQTKV